MRGDFDSVERLVPEVLMRTRLSLGDDHPAVANQLWNLASMQLRRNKAGAAEALIRECIRIRRLHFQEHWSTMEAANVLGECLTQQRRFFEAEAVLLESYPLLRSALGPEHAKSRAALRAVLELYHSWGREDQAAGYYPEDQPGLIARGVR